MYNLAHHSYWYLPLTFMIQHHDILNFLLCSTRTFKRQTNMTQRLRKVSSLIFNWPPILTKDIFNNHWGGWKVEQSEQLSNGHGQIGSSNGIKFISNQLMKSYCQWQYVVSNSVILFSIASDLSTYLICWFLKFMLL